MAEYKIIKLYFPNINGYLVYFKEGNKIKGVETEKGLFVEMHDGQRINHVIPYEYLIKVNNVSTTIHCIAN